MAPCSNGIPKRYVLSVLVFWGFFTMYALRTNLNVAIGAMVKNHTVVIDGVETEKVDNATLTWIPWFKILLRYIIRERQLADWSWNRNRQEGKGLWSVVSRLKGFFQVEKARVLSFPNKFNTPPWLTLHVRVAFLKMINSSFHITEIK